MIKFWLAKYLAEIIIVFIALIIYCIVVAWAVNRGK